MAGSQALVVTPEGGRLRPDRARRVDPGDGIVVRAPVRTIRPVSFQVFVAGPSPIFVPSRKIW